MTTAAACPDPAPRHDPRVPELGDDGPAPAYRLPLGRRGTVFYREVPGPRGAPALVLLHGWIATGALNWFRAFQPLSRHFRVIAPDLRGHGRGIRSRERFSLADCADDVAALLERLDSGPVIAVGYSMGGPVAQLLWQRHRKRVQGLVLCATSHTPVPSGLNRLVFRGAMSALARAARARGRAAHATPRLQRAGLAGEPFAGWAAAEFAGHDLRMLIEAGHAIGSYDASEWVGQIDVPTAVLVTTRDRALRPWAQMETALRIRRAVLHRLDAGHVACAQPLFGPALRAACEDVAARVA